MQLARKSFRGKALIEEIYGINLNTLEVERIMVGRDGTLAKRERDRSTSTHKLRSGMDLVTEVRSFYNLTNLISLPPDTNFETHPEVLRLHRTAEELKRARQLKAR